MFPKLLIASCILRYFKRRVWVSLCASHSEHAEEPFLILLSLEGMSKTLLLLIRNLPLHLCNPKGSQKIVIVLSSTLASLIQKSLCPWGPNKVTYRLFLVSNRHFFTTLTYIYNTHFCRALLVVGAWPPW